MKLNKNNVVDYAWKHYHNPQIFNGDEFFDDMKIFFYVKKLLTRYKKGESYNHHLTLNHVITLTNLFGVHPAVELLIYYTPTECQPALNSFFRYLSILPRTEQEVKFDAGVDAFLENL